MKTCLDMTFFGGKEGEPLVLLHGFMGSAVSFRSLVSFLPRGLCPVGIDLPGHGKSLFSGSSCMKALRSFEGVAEMILEDLSRAGIRRFWLYGYSMGGRIAQQVALTGRERVRGLILESASFGIADPEERRTRYGRDCRMLEGISAASEFEAFLDNWHNMDLFCTLSPKLKTELKAEKRKNSIRELEKAMGIMSVGNQSHLLSALSSAPFPTALFYGEKDVKYRCIAEESAKDLPMASLYEFQGASHDIHAQCPRETAVAIRSFVSDR